jgi:hypothetical protein
MKSAKYFQSPEKNLLEGTVPLQCSSEVLSITLGIVTVLMTDAFCKHVKSCTKCCVCTFKLELYEVHICYKFCKLKV